MATSATPLSWRWGTYWPPRRRTWTQAVGYQRSIRWGGDRAVPSRPQRYAMQQARCAPTCGVAVTLASVLLALPTAYSRCAPTILMNAEAALRRRVERLMVLDLFSDWPTQELGFFGRLMTELALPKAVSQAAGVAVQPRARVAAPADARWWPTGRGGVFRGPAYRNGVFRAGGQRPSAVPAPYEVRRPPAALWRRRRC